MYYLRKIKRERMKIVRVICYYSLQIHIIPTLLESFITADSMKYIFREILLA